MDDPLFMVMVPEDGERFPPETFRAPAIVKLEEVVVVPVIVKPWKVKVPLLAIEDPLVMVMVPEEGERFPPETSSADAIVKSEEVVVVPLTVKLLKTSDVPEFTIEPPVIVIVPDEGAKVAVVSFVKVPATEKLDEVVTVAPEAIVSP